MARRTLSNEVKQGILDGLKNGTSPVTLAQQFGVSIPTIYNYRKSQLNTVTTDGAVVETLTTGAATTGTAVLSPRKARKASR